MDTKQMLRSLRTVSLALLLALLVWLVILASPGLAPVAYAGSCSWTGGTSTDWQTGSNWSAGCSGAGGNPAAGDSVTIPAGTPHNPAISAVDVTITGLTVNSGATLTVGAGRTLTFSSSLSNSGTITGTGTMSAAGTSVTVSTSGSFSTAFRVASGTTIASGSFDGSITVASGAYLEMSGTVTANGDITVTGTLMNYTYPDALYFNGATFTNNGAVTYNSTYGYNWNIYVNRSGTQTITGTGSWNYVYLTIAGSSNTALANSVTLSNPTLTVNGTLTLGANTLTLNGTSLTNAGGATITGGTVRTQGSVSVSSNGTFSSVLTVASGTTIASGSFDGSITVASGATLRVSGTVTANSDITVVGSLMNYSYPDALYFNGATFTNNGAVTYNSTYGYNWNIYFNRSGAQTITGTGSWNYVYLTIAGSSNTALANSVTLSNPTLTVNGTLTLGANTLTLNGTSLTNAGGATITGGTVRTQGSVSVSSNGTFSSVLTVASGTTIASGSFDGSITVASGATLRVSGTVTANSDITVVGSLMNYSYPDALYFNGAAFTNNGAVTYNSTYGYNWNIYFNRSGAQTITGTGSWDHANLTIANSSATTIAITGTLTSLDVTINGSLTLGGNLAFSGSNCTVNSGGAMIAGSATITLTNGNFTNSGTVSGSGTLRTQSTSSYVSEVTADSAVPLNLNVASGTTIVSGTFGGSITVASGATLKLYTSVTANGDVTVAGSLMNYSYSDALYFNGATFTNNGAVTYNSTYGNYWNIYFNRSGTQAITGTGSWDHANLTIANSSATTIATTGTLTSLDVTINGSLTLGGNLAFSGSNCTVNSGGAMIAGSATITLTNGNFTNSGTVSGSGTLRTQSTSSYVSEVTADSAVPLNLNVASGTTIVSGTFGGSITVASGATLKLYTSVTANGDVTVAGSLMNYSYSDALYFNGATFTNNGAVTYNSTYGNYWNIYFNRSGTQAITGTGSWDHANLTIANSSTTTTTGAITIGSTTVTINGALTLGANLTLNSSTCTINAGGTLAVGGYQVTLNDSTLTNNGTVAGDGMLRTQGASLVNGWSTTPLNLNVAAGTTTFSAYLEGSITVAAGAQLKVHSSVSVSGDITNNGTICDYGSYGSDALHFAGGTFTNNGPVTSCNYPWSIYFGRSGAQTISGTGSFSGDVVDVLAGSTVHLGSNHQMNVLQIESGATFGLAGFSLSLNGSGMVLTNSGAFDPAGGTVVYNGTARQTASHYGISFFDLTIDNEEGVSLYAATMVSNTLDLKQGVFDTAGLLTLLSGATIVREEGMLGAAPLFGTSVNLEYRGASAVTTALEWPVDASVLHDLTINRPGGVTLAGNATVNGSLTLTAGALAIGSNTLTLNGPVVKTGGSLSSATTGTVIYNQAAAGQNVLPAQYGNLTFSNFAKVLPASGVVAIGRVFNGGTGTGHTVTGSTVELNGTAAQVLPPGFTTYNNLTLNNPAGVTGFPGLTVNGLLHVQQGTLTAASTYNNVQIDAGATLIPSAGGTINVTGNWTNNGVFKPYTSTVAFTGSAPQTIGGAATDAFQNLIINNAAGVTLNAGATISGVLSLTAGDLKTGANMVTLPKSATCTGTGDVVGTVKRSGPFTISTTYAFGNPNVSLTFASGGTLPGDVTVQMDKSAPSDFPSAINRTYTVTPGGGSGYKATLRLHYLDSELNGNPEVSLELWRSGAGWQQQISNAANVTDNWLEQANVTQFSRWTLAAATSYSKRVNAGGPAYTSALGVVWAADQPFSSDDWGWAGPSTTASKVVAISGTPDQALYQTDRLWTTTAPSGYRFSVPNGRYRVNLKFAETVGSITAAGQRVFTVKLEGAAVLTNFDIFAAAGGRNKAIDKAFYVNVKDNELDIDFVKVTNKPKVNAIEVQLMYDKRVNAGDGAYVDTTSKVWALDQPFAGGGWGYVGATSGISTTTHVISGTTDARLYQTQRLGMTGYAFTVPNGKYSVLLKFAELQYNGKNKRLFTVKLEGTSVLTNFDPWVAAGNARYAAVDKTFTVNVTDGVLNIDFLAIPGIAGGPAINAIYVTQKTATGVSTVPGDNSEDGVDVQDIAAETTEQ